MKYPFVLAPLVAITLSASALAESVNVYFWTSEGLRRVQRTVASGSDLAEGAARALISGPTTDEQANGLSSAIPGGTTLVSFTRTGVGAALDFSDGVLAMGMDDARLEAMVEQVRGTMRAFDLDRSIRLTSAGQLLSSYITGTQAVAPRPDVQSVVPLVEPQAAGSALTGKKISLSPGHGRRWGGSSWVYDRPVYCAPLSREDHHNVNLTAYLNTYLLQDGATTKAYRCLDQNFGNYSSGVPWWYMGGSYWLKQIGYPCSVYANSSGDCTLGAGASEDSDNIRCRPVAADYDNTTIHISIHTNGLSGDCAGSGCPNGTCTYYDNSAEHATWGAISQSLAAAMNNAVVDVIRTKYTDSTWRNRGALDADGDFAESRIPNRAAVLMELAFHDSCDRDGLYLQDTFFQSATMWGAYKGICDYFGVTPTWGFYSDEYVSDTIPSTMQPGQNYNVSVTFRNRGVLWKEAKAFRLGAVGDSDPLSSATRVTIAGDVDTGATYTFNFTMKAPLAQGSYTTDWRMVRDGFAWFGATHTEEVLVGKLPVPGDFDGDRDVDQSDFAHLQACFSGDFVESSESCIDARLDGDSDVDQNDFTVFIGCMTGANVEGDTGCAG